MGYMMQAIIIAAVIAALIVPKFIYRRVMMNIGTMIYAKVVAKQDRDVGWAGLTLRLQATIQPVYRITFEFGNRQSVQLQVKRKDYESVSIGSKGVLVYDVNEFRAFHVDKKIPDIVKKAAKKKNGVSFDDWLKKSAE